MSRLFAGTPFDIPPTCDRCGRPIESCDCPPEVAKPTWLPPSKQRAKIRTDQRKHRRVVTVIWGLSPDETNLPELLSVLKGHCGAGGCISNDAIELQGDHKQRVTDKLKKMEYRVG